MSLFHMSIAANEPDAVARVLSRVMGGPALPFPPCPGAWIVFAEKDDGTAIEVYPADARIEAGKKTIAFAKGPDETGPVAHHVALGTSLPAETVLSIGADAGWTARICDRGPFTCVELWVEDRVLIEVLDLGMQAAYRAGMTARSWRDMFGMESERK